jgi:hypothetical protein
MTGHFAFNYPAFIAAAERLRAAGYLVECPAENDLPIGQEWHVYLRHAIKRLVDCDAVATLPAWEHSKGARLEVLIAERLGMTIKTVPEWLQ